jgi:hypothetical protein
VQEVGAIVHALNLFLFYNRAWLVNFNQKLILSPHSLLFNNSLLSRPDDEAKLKGGDNGS